MGHASTSREQPVTDRAGALRRFYEAEVVRQVRSATLILGSRQAAQDVVHDVFAEMFQKWEGGIVRPRPLPAASGRQPVP